MAGLLSNVPNGTRFMTTQSLGEHYLEDALKTFREYKKLAERAFAQIGDEDFFRRVDDESNSIAIIVKHLAGNMLSRWTDFLTTDDSMLPARCLTMIAM